MDSPARRYMLDSSGFADMDACETETHTNWEGLFTALGISAIGWASLTILIEWLFR